MLIQYESPHDSGLFVSMGTQSIALIRFNVWIESLINLIQFANIMQPSMLGCVKTWKVAWNNERLREKMSRFNRKLNRQLTTHQKVWFWVVIANLSRESAQLYFRVAGPTPADHQDHWGARTWPLSTMAMGNGHEVTQQQLQRSCLALAGFAVCGFESLTTPHLSKKMTNQLTSRSLARPDGTRSHWSKKN